MMRDKGKYKNYKKKQKTYLKNPENLGQPAPPSTICHHNTSKPILEPKMYTNNLDLPNTTFSRP
jgi:hypothetical protein